MNRRRWWLLGLSLTLAVVGLLALMFGPLMGPQWLREAATSPMSRTAILIMVLGFVALALLGLLVKRCAERPHPPLERFFRDEGGTAAVEMLLALPIMVMVLLLMIQATLMYTANIVIHHAAYDAARTAVSMIASRLDVSGENPFMVFNDEDPRTPRSLKFARIRRSAVLTLIPISGRLPASVEQIDPEMSGEDRARVERQALERGGGDTDQGWLKRIPDQFRYADYFTDLKIRQPRHWDLPNPGTGCPWQHQERTGWDMWGWIYTPYCPNITHTFDYPPWEQLEVTLTYPFELGMPYAGRVLAKLGSAEAFSVPGTGETAYYTWLTVKVIM